MNQMKEKFFAEGHTLPTCVNDGRSFLCLKIFTLVGNNKYRNVHGDTL